MNITIRRADPRDIHVLVELTDEIQAIHANSRPDIFIYPQDHKALSQHFADILSSEKNHILLLESSEHVVGHLYAEIKSVPANLFSFPVSYLFIHQFGVRNSERGNGFGQDLLDAALKIAQDNGLGEIRLNYWSFNEPAQSFYSKNGFEVFREFVSKKLASTPVLK